MDEFILLDYIGDKIVESANKLIMEKEGRYEAITERAVMEYVPVIDAEIEMMESAEYFREAEEGILARFFAWLKKLVDAILGRNNAKDIKLPDSTEIELNSDIKKKMTLFQKAGNAFEKFFTNPVYTYLTGATLGTMLGRTIKHKEALNKGYDYGYRDGRLSGKELGEKIGKSEGITQGYQQGRKDGLKKGFKSGYDKGSDEGYFKGYDTGYNKGQIKGTQDGYLGGKSVGRSIGHAEGKEFRASIEKSKKMLFEINDVLDDIHKNKDKSKVTVGVLKKYIAEIDKTIEHLESVLNKKLSTGETIKAIPDFKNTISNMCKTANDLKHELFTAIQAEAKRQGVATGNGSSKETPAERAVPEKDEKKTGKEIAKDILKETAEYRDLVININGANSMIEKRYNDALSIVGECKSKVTSPKQFDQKYKKAKDLSQKFLAQADKVVRNFKKYVDLKDNEIKNTKKQAFMSNAEACKKEISRINDILSIYNSVTSDLLRFAKEIRSGYYTNMEEGKISRLQEYLDNANEYNKIK